MRAIFLMINVYFFFWFYRKNKSLKMWQNPWNKLLRSKNCGENMINKTKIIPWTH